MKRHFITFKAAQAFKDLSCKVLAGWYYDKDGKPHNGNGDDNWNELGAYNMYTLDDAANYIWDTYQLHISTQPYFEGRWMYIIYHGKYKEVDSAARHIDIISREEALLEGIHKCLDIIIKNKKDENG